ncbi:MAG: hypothetical protein AMS18_10865 [Gemmatimonas sp. SG8_17]|nr:MAG: hypothetical protein AMS18_10865 [Gemmatimonas sp. SG8_17]
MDPAYRWTFLGLCAMAVVVVAPRFDELAGLIRDRLGHETTPQHDQQSRDMLLDRQFDLGSGGTLTVEVPDGDVMVRTSPDSRASVQVVVSAHDRAWGRQVFERMEFAVRRSGDDLSVTATSPRVQDNEWRDNRGVGVQVEITLPQSFNLDVATSDGDIDIGDVAGRIELRTSDGDIVLGNVRGPALTVTTSDGDVSAASIAAERLAIQTHDGDVDVTVDSRSARIATGDGDIHLHLAAGGEVTLRTGDGDITIYADPSLNANVELRGEDVLVGPGFSLEGRVDRRGAQGQLSGGGPLLVAETGDGTISIRSR